MWGCDEINAQIAGVKKEIADLTEQKSAKEKERDDGQSTLESFTSVTNGMVSATESFEKGVASRIEKLPGCFGEYYARGIREVMDKSHAHEIGSAASTVISEMRSKIFDLDDAIQSFLNLIQEKNSWLRTLRNMLSDALNAVEDAFKGDE